MADVNGALTLDSNFIIVNDLSSIKGVTDGNVSFGGTETSDDFARGTASGAVSTGGIYALDIAGSSGLNRALGVQPTGSDFTPGSIVFRVQNGGAADISSIDVGFKSYYFNDQGRGNRLTWEDSLDNINYADFGESIESPAAADASPSWILATDKTGAGPTLTVGFGPSVLAPGDWYYFRFLGEDVDGSGSRDQFAIDDVSFTATFTRQVVPEPTSLAIWSMVLVGATVRRKRRYSIPISRT